MVYLEHKKEIYGAQIILCTCILYLVLLSIVEIAYSILQHLTRNNVQISIKFHSIYIPEIYTASCRCSYNNTNSIFGRNIQKINLILKYDLL